MVPSDDDNNDDEWYKEYYDSNNGSDNYPVLMVSVIREWRWLLQWWW